MLNQLFHGSAGFAWGVRASGFLTLGMLLIAICTMRTRLPPAKERPDRVKPNFKSILTDVPYMLALVG